jgi:hypothetical protein
MSGVPLRRLLVKAALLFIAANLAYAVLGPLPALGRLSLYNRLFPGRARLPYSDVPAQAYSLSTYQLEAMFASHAVAASKAEDEFRVALVGDSSTWGFLLENDGTLSAQLNRLGLEAAGKRPVFYNLGYPTLSLAKDLLVIDRLQPYRPDLIIWLVTLESFPRSRQLDSPLLQNNPETVRALIERYDLNLDPQDPRFVEPQGFLDRTLIGQRRPLADMVRLQLYGVMWAATGIDQFIPARYDPPQNDFEVDDSFHDLDNEQLAESLSFDILRAGFAAAGETPVLLVNEPIFIASGENSEIRYNFFYPRWAYDRYRELLAAEARAKGWSYLDAWDRVPAQRFTNSAIHLDAEGERLLAEEIARMMQAFDGESQR